MRIDSRKQLVALAKKLGVRPDWHEPDEQEVDVRVRGRNFDNAGFWGRDFENSEMGVSLKNLGCGMERYVEIFQGKEKVGEVNLATLFSMACGEGD